MSTPSQQPAPVSPSHTLAVLITLVFCTLFSSFFLPTQINNKAQAVLTPIAEQARLALQTPGPDKTTELIAYLQDSQEGHNSESDDLSADDITEHYDTLEDFTSKANQILSSRFKKPQDADGITLPNEEDFIPSAGLKDTVTFWTHIFGVYDKNYMIFYNENDVGIVYSVLDFSDIADSKDTALKGVQNNIIHDEASRLIGILKKIASRVKTDAQVDHNGHVTIPMNDFNADEKRIASLLVSEADQLDLSEDALLESFKYRNGFSHRIKQAIATSGKYMDEMRRIFRERGLPEQLTAIPYVESCFNLQAYSSAGAAGVWQFIEPTGQRYLHIDEYTDERYDPILATYAAATHLANEYNMLKSWALTINAYNTGPGRMLDAIKDLNSRDITTIIKTYNGSGYGFDSRNYYPEFLAALEVYTNRDYYFGDLKTSLPEDYQYVALPAAMNIPQLAVQAGLNIDELAALNPGLKDGVLSGDMDLPRGYLLKIDPQAKANVTLAMQQLYAEVRYASHHLVEQGDTLKDVAKRYDVSIKDLALANNVLPGQKLVPGTMIQIPERTDAVEVSLSTPNSNALTDESLPEVQPQNSASSTFVVPDNVLNPIF